MRYLSGDDHGYIDLHVTKNAARARYMAVDTVESPDYQAFEKAAFDIAKKDGVAMFKDTDGLSFKEGWLF